MNILDESNELRAYEVRRVILAPKQWNTFTHTPSLSWVTNQMSATKPANIPDNKRGVYTFVVDPGIGAHPKTSYLLYVGKAGGAKGFRARYETYYAERNKADSNRPLINRMVKSWFDHLWFCFAEVPDPLIVPVEDALLKAYLPPFNTEFPATVSAAVRAFQ